MKVLNKLALFGLLLAMTPSVLAEDPDSAALNKAALTYRKEKLHTYLLNIYIAQKRKPEAMTEYKYLVAMKPNDPRLNCDLGKFEASSGQLASAIAHIKKACELDPSNAQYWSMLGSVYLKAKEYQNALDAFDQGVGASRKLDSLEGERYRELRNQTFEYVQHLKGKSRVKKQLVAPVNNKHINSDENDDW